MVCLTPISLYDSKAFTAVQQSLFAGLMLLIIMSWALLSSRACPWQHNGNQHLRGWASRWPVSNLKQQRYQSLLYDMPLGHEINMDISCSFYSCGCQRPTLASFFSLSLCLQFANAAVSAPCTALHASLGNTAALSTAKTRKLIMHSMTCKSAAL